MKRLENLDSTMTSRNQLKNSLNLRVLLAFFFIIINFSSIVAKECKGYYVTNNLDTIKCKIDITQNIFYKGVYNFHRISEGVKLIDAEGVKNFKPQEIESFVVFVPSGDTCKFVSLQTDNRYFYHEMVVGKISMYLKYQTHPYDKGMITECVFLKNNEFTKLGFMSTRRNQKEKVSLLLSDNPEVLAKWETAKISIESLQEITIEYNK